MRRNKLNPTLRQPGSREVEYFSYFPTILDRVGASAIREYKTEQQQRLDIDDEEERRLVKETSALVNELMTRTVEKLKMIPDPTENLKAMSIFKENKMMRSKKDEEEGHGDLNPRDETAREDEMKIDEETEESDRTHTGLGRG
jgi:hypothetical protein